MNEKQTITKHQLSNFMTVFCGPRSKKGQFIVFCLCLQLQAYNLKHFFCFI